MYISPISYQANYQSNVKIKKSNNINFKSKNTLNKLVEANGKRTFLSLLGGVLAYLGLTKNTKDNIAQKEELSEVHTNNDNDNIPQKAVLREEIRQKLDFVDCNNEFGLQICKTIISNDDIYRLRYKDCLKWFICYDLKYIQSQDEVNLVNKILQNGRLVKGCSYDTINDIVKSTRDIDIEKNSVNNEEKYYNQSELVNSKIEMLDKILSDNRLSENEQFVKDILNDLALVTPNNLQSKIAMIDKILSDERFYGNKKFMDSAYDFVYYTSPENINFKLAMADKILSDKRLFNNDSFMKNAPLLVYNIRSQENLKFGSQVIDKILSDEKLYNNDGIMSNAYQLIKDISSDFELQRKIKLVNMALLDNSLRENPKFFEHAVFIINSVKTPEQMQVAERILSDKKLCTNKVFLFKGSSIIKSIQDDNKKPSSEVLNFVDKLLSDERFYSNEDLIQYASSIISKMNEQPKRANFALELIDRLSADEKCLNNSNVISNLAALLLSVLNSEA